MTIRYQCEECGAALNINDELAGSEGNCPRCQVQFTVPAPDSNAGPQPAVSQPAVEAGQRSSSHSDGGPLSEDEIGELLSAEPAPSSSSDRRLSTADSDDEIQTEQVNPFDDEADETESEKRSKNQKSKRAGSPAVKPDSTESIARNLMGRGGPQPAVRDEPEKKKRRPFGGRDERHPGELTSIKDVVAYFAKIGWPFAAIIVTVVGLLVWLSVSMMKRFDAPPLAPVTGTVTLDGKPLKLAIVKFVPIFQGPDGYKQGSSSFGWTDAEGKYTLTYANENDKPIMGAIIGPHQVQIQLNDISGAQLIPERYSTYSSDLKVDVKKGMLPADFALKSDPVESPE